jgi:hypothetical protein
VKASKPALMTLLIIGNDPLDRICQIIPPEERLAKIDGPMHRMEVDSVWVWNNRSLWEECDRIAHESFA